MSKTDIRTELGRELDDIAKLLENDLDSVLNSALDVEVFVGLPRKVLTGFKLGIATGSPNIYLVYDWGKCRLVGYWGSAEDERDIDTEICETVAEYLSDQF